VSLQCPRCLSDSSNVGYSSSKSTGNNEIQYYSSKGAFNGTGISWTSVFGSTNLTTSKPKNKNVHNDRFLFFQHHTGQIRWIYQGGPDQWSGGTGNEVIATDAKNGTPISAHSPRGAGLIEYNIFCKFFGVRFPARRLT
jgi:hypothetical protein